VTVTIVTPFFFASASPFAANTPAVKADSHTGCGRNFHASGALITPLTLPDVIDNL
jgi:hypothetical protein